MPWTRKQIREMDAKRLERRARELEDRLKWRDESDDPLAVELRRANPEAVPGYLSHLVNGRHIVDGWWVRTVERGRKAGKYVVWYRVFAGGLVWKKAGVIPDHFFGYDSDKKFF